MNKKVLAIFFAILTACLYAINIPLSNLLLKHIAPMMMACYLYLGVGLGIGFVFLLIKKNQTQENANFSVEKYLSCGVIERDILRYRFIDSGTLHE